jgi:hypothetical protein
MSWRTCFESDNAPCAMFETTKLPRLMLALQLPIILPARLSSLAHRMTANAVRLRASGGGIASPALSSAVAGSHQWWLGPASSGCAMYRVSEACPILVQPWHGSPAPLRKYPPTKERTVC